MEFRKIAKSWNVVEEKMEITVGIQMFRAFSFGKLQEIWAFIWGDASFQIFSVCSAHLDILCSGTFSHLVKCYSFNFMHNSSTHSFV